MEELSRLAKEYYKTIIKIRYFGLAGGALIFLSIPFMILSVLLKFKYDLGHISLFPFGVSAIMWVWAKSIYDKNLITYLTFFTHLDSKNINLQKAHYISTITFHISSSLHETTKIFKDIQDTENRNKTFVLDNIGYYFTRFLYDPESKNRILSLVIYMISLIALITVIKQPLEYNVYELLHEISFKAMLMYFSLCFFVIVFFYFILVMPIMFFTTFVITPLMLKLSNVHYLNSYFISEMNRFSFYENKIKIS